MDTGIITLLGIFTTLAGGAVTAIYKSIEDMRVDIRRLTDKVALLAETSASFGPRIEYLEEKIQRLESAVVSIQTEAGHHPGRS